MLNKHEVTIVIPIRARGKQSVRNARIKKKDGKTFNLAYIPKQTKDYMKIISTHALKIPAHIRKEYLEARYYIVDIECYFKPPKSYSKKRQQALLDGVYYPEKPDKDNIEKAIYDALTGILIKDDKSVVDGMTPKKYSDKDQMILTIKAYWEEASNITTSDVISDIDRMNFERCK